MTAATKALSPFAGIAAAANAGVEFDESSLTIVDPDLPYEVYEDLLASAGRVKRSMSWWIGDLLNFGDGLYPDRYSQALDVTGLKPETLSNYAWVCRSVARSRRRDLLPFGVHDVVAGLEPAEQDFWLAKADAARPRWTTSQMREALRRARDPEPPPPPYEVLPAAPLSPRAITEAAGSLAAVHDTLSALGSGDAVPAGAIPKAARDLERVSETLRVAATIPTLRDLVVRLIAEAEPHTIGGTSLVLTATLDELRELVSTKED